LAAGMVLPAYFALVGNLLGSLLLELLLLFGLRLKRQGQLTVVPVFKAFPFLAKHLPLKLCQLILEPAVFAFKSSVFFLELFALFLKTVYFFLKSQSSIFLLFDQGYQPLFRVCFRLCFHASKIPKTKGLA